MVRVDWAQPALDDLEGIYDFIARDSPRYARDTVEKIIQSADRLSNFPHMGQELSEFPHLAYRQLVVGVYRLIYREDSRCGRVIVMGVVHGSRDLSSVLENR